MYGQNISVPLKKLNTWPPRATALSEVLWSNPIQKDWYSFWARLQHHFERLDNRGVNYAPHYEGQLSPHE